MTEEEIEKIARELWWPHHQSRTRDTALAELDSGSLGEVTMQFEDVVDIVRKLVQAKNAD